MNEKVLSAREGGDEILRRYEERKNSNIQEIEPDDNSIPYLCVNCGTPDFLVIHSFDEQRNFSFTLECTCGKEEVAGTKTFLERRKCQNIGRLTDEHRVDWEEKNVDDVEQEIVEEITDCQECWSEEAQNHLDKEEEWEQDLDSEYWEVLCESCSHEIEFGWSHPNREGRIWPCESSDFNPWISWPEPRFIEDWKRRSWLRPRKRTIIKESSK